MKPSVTILLPIHNAQHRLERQVAEILDVLPELTSRFELMIIDDGSTDDSFDVARHLSLKYPQVSALRHPSRLGLAQAVQSGLEQTDGDLVLVGDEQHGVRADDLRRLWHSYSQQAAGQQPKPDANLEPAVSTGQARWFEKMLGWKPGRKPTAEPQSVPGIEPSRQDQAAEIAEGVQRRVDSREKAAGRKSIVQPLYLAQRRQVSQQSAGDRLPPGYGSVDRGSAPRGPADRRQKS